MGVQNIGKNLRALRKRRGLTLEEMARITGVSAPTICKLESGNYNVRFDIISQISDRLKLSLVDLCRNSKLECIPLMSSYTIEDTLHMLDERLTKLDLKYMELYFVMDRHLSEMEQKLLKHWRSKYFEGNMQDLVREITEVIIPKRKMQLEESNCSNREQYTLETGNEISDLVVFIDIKKTYPVMTKHCLNAVMQLVSSDFTDIGVQVSYIK